jgi:acetyl-CoA acetyltransferase
MAFVVGSAATRYGDHAGEGTLDLMTGAAAAALDDAGLGRDDVDGVLCGYSTTFPHLMLATVFAEHFGLSPSFATAVQSGGASGLAMVAAAADAVDAGRARRVLVVAGENRMTGQTRDSAVSALAQVGHPRYEVALGATVPAYYGLLASRYLHETGATEADLAALAVLMRSNAAGHPGAHFRAPITVDDVLGSRPVASPLKLLDCCPVSDGGAALVVSAGEVGDHGLRIAGHAQAHPHQHLTAAPELVRSGAATSGPAALAEAGLTTADVDYLAVYDSFTVTLAILLEDLGFAPRGGAGAAAAAGRFDRDGGLPLNTHGGLLSYGHCGVGGALAHVAEAHRQLTGRAGERQVASRPRRALLHGDGGVMSSHVSMVLVRP